MPSLTVNVDPPPQQVTVDPAPMDVSANVDLNDLVTVLTLVGFPDLDTAQAVAQAESGCYSDAVGDLDITSPKWGPSIGLFQIRSLRSPQTFYGGPDQWRYAWPLRDPIFNAKAAFAISKGGTDWTPWSTFTSGAYKTYLGQKPAIKTGHSAAASWWK